MTTATTGVGTITLGAAKAGYATFGEAGLADADTTRYVIIDGNDYEIGIGTYTSAGTTLSRDTVLESKIAGVFGTAKISLSGSAEVFVSALPDDLPALPAVTPDIVDIGLFGDASDGNKLKTATFEDLFRAIRRKAHNYGFYFFTDFIQETSTTGNDGTLIENNTGTGAGTSAQATDAVNHPGVARSSTGTTAGGRAPMVSSLSAIRLGGGELVFEALVNVATLSDATEGYSLLVGLIDTIGNVNQQDACCFMYDERNASGSGGTAGNWQSQTANNNVRTYNGGASGSSAVTAGQWDRLKIVVNAAATQVDFYVNDTLRFSHTANIPTGAGRELGFGWHLLKSVGTTARTVDFDYVMVEQDFTTAR